MPRQRPVPRAGGRRGGWLLRSFAVRLGIGFAVVVVAGATLTAVVVNTAFAARFDRYVRQQQAAQLGQISTAISRAYSGNGTWDRQALETVVPAVAAGTVRVLTPSGHDVWQWDGHTMRWDEHQTDDGAEHGGQPAPGPDRPDGDGSDSRERGDQHATTERSSWPGGDGPGSQFGLRDLERSQAGVTTAGQPLASRASGDLVAVAAPTSTTSPTTGSGGLGPVQRIPIEVGGTVVGTALVRQPQATALPAAVAFRSQVIRLLLGGGALGALLSLALGIFFARRATRPVRQITGAARALAAGDRSVRLDVGRADEFGEMGRAFNAMADAVDTQERLRRGFAADVAHELRTPLTILRSQVEGLEPTDQALGSLDEEVRRMARLVADLQVLSAADAAGFSLERATTDLEALVEEALGEFAGLFEGAEVRLETHLEPATAWVDSVRVGQVLANLLSNALKFTPAGGLVRVELQPEGDWVVLRVADSGPGIPADELPRIFDRFYQGRSSRAAGSGIGLTVVRELVGAHGGSVEAASQPGRGATFTVRLPVQTTAPGNRFHTASSQPRPTVRA